jgi:hypothetical protein
MTQTSSRRPGSEIGSSNARDQDTVALIPHPSHDLTTGTAATIAATAETTATASTIQITPAFGPFTRNRPFSQPNIRKGRRRVIFRTVGDRHPAGKPVTHDILTKPVQGFAVEAPLLGVAVFVFIHPVKTIRKAGLPRRIAYRCLTQASRA